MGMFKKKPVYVALFSRSEEPKKKNAAKMRPLAFKENFLKKINSEKNFFFLKKNCFYYINFIYT